MVAQLSYRGSPRHFGQAEVFLKALESFEPGEDLETIQELVTLLEVTEQATSRLLKGDPSYTAAAPLDSPLYRRQQRTV